MAEIHYPDADRRHADANRDVNHETSDVNVRGVFGFGIGLILIAVFVYFGVWLVYMYFNGRAGVSVAPAYPLAVGQENRQPPEPRLQVNPREDLKQMRDEEDVILNTYGWVDKNNGVVRIPIDDAMKLALQRGLPARQSGGK
jgi:hypothetical protein